MSSNVILELFHRRVLFGRTPVFASVNNSSFVLGSIVVIFGSDGNIFLAGGGLSSSLVLIVFSPLSEKPGVSSDDRVVLFLVDGSSSEINAVNWTI